MPGLREYPPPTSLAVSDGSATSSTLQAPAAPSASSVRLSTVDMWTTRAPPTNPRDQKMSKNLIAHSTQTRSVTTSDRQPGNRDTRRRIRYLFWPPFTNPPGPSPSLPISNGRSAGSTIWGQPPITGSPGQAGMLLLRRSPLSQVEVVILGVNTSTHRPQRILACRDRFDYNWQPKQNPRLRRNDRSVALVAQTE